MFVLSVVDSSTPTISNTQVFKTISGTIVSPNYPRNYSSWEFRKYIISVENETRKGIMLTFNNFDVQNDDFCAYDYLEASTSQ